MSNPAAAVSTSAGRYYQLDLPAALANQTANVKRSGDTIWLPSVTNVLDSMSKPGLVWWSAGLVATEVFTDPDRITQLVAAAHNGRTITGFHPCEACRQPTDHYLDDKGKWFHTACYDRWRTLRKVFNDQRIQKADLGSLVHALVEKHILGDPVDPADYPPEVAGRVEAWQRFVTKHEPSFELAEATVFNLTHGYAGTLDIIMDVGGHRWLVDVKSGTPTVYESHALQLAAYRYAEHVYVGAGVVEALPVVDRCAILFLGEDRFKFEPVDVGVGDLEEGFLPLLRFQRWQTARA